jgi:hypothetical protein
MFEIFFEQYICSCIHFSQPHCSDMLYNSLSINNIRELNSPAFRRVGYRALKHHF